MSKDKPEKEMLINTVEGQECRIALVEHGVLEELYVERTASASHVGNIYKARITNVEPAIQAAFVDAGLGRNGFLHVSDINPSHFPKGKKAPEEVGRKRPHYVRPPIQECLRRGQEVIVQMTKEGIGTKGPTLTTYLSIPGRLLVMMPSMTRLGVSRKVEDAAARGRARQALSELELPQDMGFIIRTAGVDRAKRDLQRDLNYLLRLWKVVKQRIKITRAPVELYRESDLVTRTIRDVYNSEIRRIICDDAAVARRVEEFLNVVVPRTKHTVELYTGKQGLFYDYGMEEEIEKIHSRRVELPSGGSLVIDQTEALVAIDVNSGRYRQHTNAETTALKTNLEAAKEVVRQLRLRDLGGVIVIDFIDLREEKNRRTLERAVRETLKHDRAKTKALRASAFGIIELTRQRLGPSLKQSAFTRCPHCDGLGVVRSEESLSLLVMRKVQRACAHDDVARIEVSLSPTAANQLNNSQRQQISRLETETGKTIVIRADARIGPGNGQTRCTNARGTEVAWEHPAPARPSPERLSTTRITDVPPEAQPEPDEPTTPEEPTEPAEEAKEQRKKGRRGRRGGRRHKRRAADGAAEPPPPGETEQADKAIEPPAAAGEPAEAAPKAKRRRRRPAKRQTKEEPAARGEPDAAGKTPVQGETEKTDHPQEATARAKTSRRRRKSRKRRPAAEHEAADKQAEPAAPVEKARPEAAETAPKPAPKRRGRKRPRSRKAAGKASDGPAGEADAPAGGGADESPGPE